MSDVYEVAYRAGRTYEDFLADVNANRELWLGVSRRVDVDSEVVERAREVEGGWRILAIADDWCGDAVNILPVVARLVDAVDGVELRIVGREQIPGLMERHLTNGSRSIPVFILLDGNGTCHGWWGPRPPELQAWFESAGRSLPKPARYRELRRWYARDRGRTVADEIVDLLERGSAGGAGCHRARDRDARAA